MASIAFKKLWIASALICLTGVASASTAYEMSAWNSNTLARSASSQSNDSFNDLFKLVTEVLPGAPGSSVSLSSTNFNGMAQNYRSRMGTSTAWGGAPLLSDSPKFSVNGVVLPVSFSNTPVGPIDRSSLAGVSISEAYSKVLLGMPEPESNAMLLIGLGLMGVIALRRNSSGSRP